MWLLAIFISIIIIGMMPLPFIILVVGGIVVFLVASFFEYRRMKKNGTWEDYKKWGLGL